MSFLCLSMNMNDLKQLSKRKYWRQELGLSDLDFSWNEGGQAQICRVWICLLFAEKLSSLLYSLMLHSGQIGIKNVHASNECDLSVNFSAHQNHFFVFLI